ncbi:MAG: HNH endonuclease [Bacilli bacterium]
MEQWKSYGKYKVSNYGRIETRRGIGYGSRIKTGYSHGRLGGIHRIVAELFIPNPENCRYVVHVNGDKFDNRAVNLAWSDVREYSQPPSVTDRMNAPLSLASAPNNVAVIDSDGVIYDSVRHAIEVTGISRASVYKSLRTGEAVRGITFKRL